MIATAPPEPKRVYRFTKEQFYRFVESGEFGDTRVELINGEVVPMPAQSNWHGWGIDALLEILKPQLMPAHWVRVQMSLDLSPMSVPDPDIAVIAQPRSMFRKRENPKTAILIVEVSERTLAEDRVRKASLYAASGIPDYWILNLVHRQLEVYRNPVKDPAEEFGWRYSTTTTHDAGEVVTMLAVPHVSVNVEELLP
jgi:Uma2 family endonuclease